MPSTASRSAKFKVGDRVVRKPKPIDAITARSRFPVGCLVDAVGCAEEGDADHLSMEVISTPWALGHGEVVVRVRRPSGKLDTRAVRQLDVVGLPPEDRVVPSDETCSFVLDRDAFVVCVASGCEAIRAADGLDADAAWVAVCGVDPCPLTVDAKTQLARLRSGGGIPREVRITVNRAREVVAIGGAA